MLGLMHLKVFLFRFLQKRHTFLRCFFGKKVKKKPLILKLGKIFHPWSDLWGFFPVSGLSGYSCSGHLCFPLYLLLFGGLHPAFLSFLHSFALLCVLGRFSICCCLLGRVGFGAFLFFKLVWGLGFLCVSSAVVFPRLGGAFSCSFFGVSSFYSVRFYPFLLEVFLVVFWCFSLWGFVLFFLPGFWDGRCFQ